MARRQGRRLVAAQKDAAVLYTEVTCLSACLGENEAELGALHHRLAAADTEHATEMHARRVSEQVCMPCVGLGTGFRAVVGWGNQRVAVHEHSHDVEYKWRSCLCAYHPHMVVPAAPECVSLEQHSCACLWCLLARTAVTPACCP